VKTDKRDARTLCDALRLGAYRPIHRVSECQRHVRAELAVREALVRTRTRYIAMIKAAVRREGLRLPSGDAEHTVTKLTALDLPAVVRLELAPLVAQFSGLNAAIAAADDRLTTLAKQETIVRRLCTMPTIGPITALAFVAALDDVPRFASASQVQAYLGLVPSEYSSADRRVRGRITKRGDVRTRYLLVEAGWRLLRSNNPAVAPLKAWAETVARRRGRRIAAVALARRIAGILFAMWRDAKPFHGMASSAAA
jgi:transposase